MNYRRLLYLSTLGIGIPTIGMTAGTLYLYPDIKNDYTLIGSAFKRIYRVTKGGLKMASIYMNDSGNDLTHYKAAAVLRDTFLQNGGIYLKFGQLIASLDYIVPDTYRETFQPFLTQCPQTSFKEIKAQIEKSTKKQLDQIFRDFNELPISSASIAQVHEATLLDGRRVAVKVQHPQLRLSADGDIRLIEILIDVGGRLFPDFKYKWFAEELRDHIPKELNFENELYNLKRASYELRKIDNFSIPQTVDEYCNDLIITMEYVDGILLTQVDRLKSAGYDLKKISTTLSKVFTQQIFQNGFIHSDPHQGNIIIKGPKGNPQVVLIDHGLYQRVDDDVRLNYNKLWKAIIQQDEEGMAQSSYALGVESDFKLFSGMITSRNYETIMENKDSKQRLGRPSDPHEIEQLKLKAMERHKDIISMLNQINRPLLLLFKVNEFLRNIDYQLGSPINSYYYTYQTVCDVIFKDQMRSMTFFQRFLYRIEFWCHKIQLLVAKSLL